MWQQPEDIFEEYEFTYNITARAVKTGALLNNKMVTFNSSASPREKFNFSEADVCKEITFTLSQVGDCREKNTTVFLPICKDTLLIKKLYFLKLYTVTSSRTISFWSRSDCSFL